MPLKVHLEAAASAGVTPHLSRLAKESVVPGLMQQQRRLQWPKFRVLVVPMLVGMVSCSASTRNKLWTCDGLDIFLQLLKEKVSREGGQGRSFFLLTLQMICVGWLFELPPHCFERRTRRCRLVFCRP